MRSGPACTRAPRRGSSEIALVVDLKSLREKRATSTEATEAAQAALPEHKMERSVSLWHAVLVGDEDEVDSFIQQGADCNAMDMHDGGRTALMKAAAVGLWEVRSVGNSARPP